MHRRKLFFQIAGIGLGAVFVFLWNKITLQHLKLNSGGKKTYPFNKQKEVLFQDDFIITNSNQTTTVFSAHCTHLGCKINKFENGRFICPCHGSQYSLNGEVLQGPAFKHLKKHRFNLSEDQQSIEISDEL